MKRIYVLTLTSEGPFHECANSILYLIGEKNYLVVKVNFLVTVCLIPMSLNL